MKNSSRQVTGVRSQVVRSQVVILSLVNHHWSPLISCVWKIGKSKMQSIKRGIFKNLLAFARSIPTATFGWWSSSGCTCMNRLRVLKNRVGMMIECQRVCSTTALNSTVKSCCVTQHTLWNQSSESWPENYFVFQRVCCVTPLCTQWRINSLKG